MELTKNQAKNPAKNQQEEQGKLDALKSQVIHSSPICYYPFRSHFARFLLKVILFLTFFFTVMILSASLSTLPIAIPILTLTLLTLLFCYSVWKTFKELRFDATFLYTVATGKNEWWSPITDQIILGAIPLENHSKELQANQVSHLVTMLEPFELKAGLITPLYHQIKLMGIQCQLFACRDFQPVPTQTIHEAVQYIHQALASPSSKVYVHCKAGRGRSAAIVIAYLLKYGIKEKKFSSIEDAYAYVKSKREKVNLNKKQKEAIYRYYKSYVAL